MPPKTSGESPALTCPFFKSREELESREWGIRALFVALIPGREMPWRSPMRVWKNGGLILMKNW